MKINRTFIVCLLALLAIAVALQLQVPGKFDWKTTWSPNSSDPFGCQEFDSVLRESMPNGYTTHYGSLWQFVDSKKRQNVLLIAKSADLDSLMVKDINKFTKHGNKLLLIISDTYYDSKKYQSAMGFYLSSGYSYFNIDLVREQLGDNQNLSDTIYWVGKGYPKRKYRALKPLLDEDTVALSKEVHWDTLAYTNSWNIDSTRRRIVPIAFRRKMNNGELIVASDRMLFTNYGMLEGETSGYIFRILNYISDKPVVRLTDELPTVSEDEMNGSPFRAIFRSRQLTWAFYLTLFVLLLFFIFSARRRQRAIPVISAPRNHTLEFTKLIGTLFYQRHDHTGLLRRKWDLFAADIRQTVGVDVQALDDDDTLFRRLSECTGMEYEDIAKKIKNIRYLVMNDIDVNSIEMKDAIDDMNEIAEKSR